LVHFGTLKESLYFYVSCECYVKLHIWYLHVSNTSLVPGSIPTISTNIKKQRVQIICQYTGN